jgi:glucose-6-phosphate dehydrogenase assembly protein OpcA
MATREIYKVIAQLSPAATTLTTLYTVPAATETVVSSIIVTNRSNSNRSFRIAISVAGAAIDNKHYIAYDTAIGGNGVQEFTTGMTLAATDVIRVYAGSAELSFNVFGTEIANV